MSLLTQGSRFNYTLENWPAAPISTIGTSVTPGTSNVWGSWVEVLPNIAYDCHMLELTIFGSSTSGADRSMLLDIGIDPAGGTSYVSIFGDAASAGSKATKALVCAPCQSITNGVPSTIFAIPIRMIKESAIAVRLQTTGATSTASRVIAAAYGSPSHPESLLCGSVAEIIGPVASGSGTYDVPGTTTCTVTSNGHGLNVNSQVLLTFSGTTTDGAYTIATVADANTFTVTVGSATDSGTVTWDASRGVTFIPGNSAYGSWTAIGTTTRALFWWQLGAQISNNTTTALYYYFDLAYGDGSNYVQIYRQFRYTTTSEAVNRQGTLSEYLSAYCPVPAGATLYVRGRCSGTAETGWNANVMGIG